MGGFAYRITSIGAESGLMVTPIGYQAGARLIAQHERIGLATLNADATEDEFLLTVADQLYRGLKSTDQGHGVDEVASVARRCGRCNSDLSSSDGGQTFFCAKCT